MVPEIETEPTPKSDFAIGLLVYASTAFVFFPLTRFLVAQTVGQDQLLHSFLVLTMAGTLLIYERRVDLRPIWELGKWSRMLLVGSYLVVVGVLFTGWTLLMIPAFCLAVASGAIWVFGERVKRMVGALTGAFALFQGFVLLLPAFDWPLRGIAGRLSGWGLQQVGKSIELGVNTLTKEPQLVLMSNEQPFIVAAECNGYGVIVSAFLLSMLLVLYRRIPVAMKLGAVVGAGITGVIFNAIRITIIVVLAPIVGQKHYLLMHEIVGTIVYYAALIVIWVLIQRIPSRSKIQVASIP